MPAASQASNEERPERGWARRPRYRRPPPLEPFPESLGDLVCGLDPGVDPVDALTELTAHLLRERDPRARLVAEAFLDVYPYRPIAHWLWGRALAQAGSYRRASAVLRNLLSYWPDFPGRASVQTQLDDLPAG